MATRETIFLLVEDNPNDALLVELGLQRVPNPEDFWLVKVCDGAEAMDYLRGTGRYADRLNYPLPDVILLDLNMPRVNGFEFLKWLRSESPDGQKQIPVIVMSSSHLKTDIDTAYDLGASSYLLKPVDWNLFRDRVKTLGVDWSEHVETPNMRPQ